MLWAIKAPPKVKNMVWRAIVGCLSTRVQLRSKHVNVVRRCPICELYSETILYCLVTCTFAKSCWEYAGFQFDTTESEGFTEWIWSFFDSVDVKRMELTLRLCWAIWKSRNDVVGQQKKGIVREVVVSARANLDQSLGPWTSGDGAEL